MKIKAYAKVNLNLKVFLKTNKDTKHKIKSLITIYKHIYDEIFIQPSNKTSVTYLVNNKKITIANDVVSKSIK
jgi:4-diphosphocytidyl-2C-methyl-D-erythritol kinase